MEYQCVAVLSEQPSTKQVTLLAMRNDITNDNPQLRPLVDQLINASEFNSPESISANRIDFIATINRVLEVAPKCLSLITIVRLAFDLSTGAGPTLGALKANLLLQSIKNIKRIEITDIYGRFLAKTDKVSRSNNNNNSDDDPSDIMISTIDPCTEQHIRKAIQAPVRMLCESPNAYNIVTMPYFNAIPPARTAWIHQILSGEKEADVAIYHDKHPTDGFVVVPDMKWDQKTSKGLYIQTIVMDGSIRSLRDLRAHHIPLLTRIRTTLLTLIPLKYPFISPTSLRLFIHYLPSYFHFHIHCAHMSLEESGMMAGRAHLLDAVIENLEIDAEYYKRCRLFVAVNEAHDLFEGLRDLQ